MRRLITVFLSLAVVGCAQTRTGSGDLRPFLGQLLSEHEFHLPPISNVPTMQATWSIKKDSNGFVLDIAGDSFAVVDKYLRSYFGAPELLTESTLEYQSMGVFRSKRTSASIEYFRSKTGTRITCVKKQKAQQSAR